MHHRLNHLMVNFNTSPLSNCLIILSSFSWSLPWMLNLYLKIERNNFYLFSNNFFYNFTSIYKNFNQQLETYKRKVQLIIQCIRGTQPLSQLLQMHLYNQLTWKYSCIHPSHECFIVNSHTTYIFIIIIKYYNKLLMLF